MKRVKAGCIAQTLVFSQKADLGYSREEAWKINHQELDRYQAVLDRTRTRYQIVDVADQEDGSVVVHVRKQYSDKADVSEYFV